MGDVSSVGLINEEEEDQIELSLELSIGGRSYRKKSMDLTCESSIVNTDKGGLLSSGVEISDGGAGALMDCLDTQKKRGIQLLRRQEAKKKREQKMKKSALCREMNGGFLAKNGLLESEQSLNKVIREKREHGEDVFGYEKMKKTKEERDYFNLKLAHNASSSLLVNPCVVPWWGTVSGNSGEEEGQNGKNFLQKDVTCRSFRPSARRNLSACYDSEYGSSLNGSLGRSSSSVSDYESTSQKGVSSSSDTRSRVNYSQAALQPNASSTIDPPEQFQWSRSSNLMESDQFIDKAANSKMNVVSFNGPQLIHTKAGEQSKSIAPLDPVNKLISKTRSSLASLLMAETKAVSAKPQTPQNHDIRCLQQMPCVSTTGNGPNGKTITGLLYRYTNTEVIIVCACHGSSYSPAEFVEHAGGIDVAHPLRHITMVPSALG